MRNLIITISLLITASFVYSQEAARGVVVKSNNKNEPIPYVSIVYLNKSGGVYANEAGEFVVNVQPDDTLMLSSIGFKKLILACADLIRLKYVVSLEEDTFALPAITIDSKRTSVKSSIESFGYHHAKKRTRLISRTPGFQIATKIENQKKREGGYVESILLNMVSSGKSRIRLHLYAPDGFPATQAEYLREEVVVDLGWRKGIVKVDVSKHGITFPKEGLIVSVEFMGNLGKNKKVIAKNGVDIESKIFLSRGDDKKNTWIGFMGRGFEPEFYSQISNTTSNAMVGVSVRFYEDVD